MDKAQLALRFKQFAAMEYEEVPSVLYQFLSLEIAKDHQLLELCSNARKGQPVPNLLFAAVHYLLLKGKDHPLKEFYPSISKTPRRSEERRVGKECRERSG